MSEPNLLRRNRKRNGRAAIRFFRILLKHQGCPPRVLIADKFASYRVAHRQMMSSVEHRRNKYSSNRCENSHQPTRQRERAMTWSHSVGAAQRFLAVFSRISRHCSPPRRGRTTTDHRTEMVAGFQAWDQVTEPTIAA
ncbi:DDE-type integrase/transposase/recombinase [Rhodococcus sp. IEGM 1379]|uniref:DDE-type integrase/transposase/recombinase n=1 Tax=Rhodococcus sp. IEGM 1379 TaxID=3047086 RepID=UPI0024B658DB|nr:DDE-type integrase/transposase/recombinase [Rhodococcus sp. IEGM 1379]MDI9915583.1 DDE-type integrase/transposase/recombinase [Rhodococcus sp. IEGM 1379]